MDKLRSSQHMGRGGIIRFNGMFIVLIEEHQPRHFSSLLIIPNNLGWNWDMDVCMQVSRTYKYVVFEKMFVMLVIGLKNLFKELLTLFSNYYSWCLMFSWQKDKWEWEMLLCLKIFVFLMGDVRASLERQVIHFLWMWKFSII